MMDLLRDRYKIGLFMATLFFIGILASAYTIYRLPHNLMLAEGYQPAFFNTYVTLALTFLMGAFTV
ncbi:MAG: hypothetical protein ACOYXT_10440, partial [Bacteroidota bacterium]